jgi:hypothetical protein
MFKTTMALTFCLVSTFANAQSQPPVTIQKKVVCSSISDVVRMIMNEPYTELPIWNGLDSDKKARYSLFHNQKTNTFTIIEFNDKVACILGEGIESQIEIRR